MKLLRVTSNDSSGVIKSFLNQDLRLPPQSQIALGQLNTKVNDTEIEITQENNKITFETKAGDTREIFLNTGVFNSNNFQVLLENLEQEINEAIGELSLVTENGNNKYSIKTASNIGRQAQVSEIVNGKVNIAFSQSKSIAYIDDLKSHNIKNQLSFTGTSEATYRVKSTLATGKSEQYDHLTYQTHSMCKGVGVARCRIYGLDNTQNKDNNAGYTLILTKTNPDSFLIGSNAQSMTLSRIDFGIQCMDPYGTGVYSYIRDGIITPTSIVPNNTSPTSANNDVPSIELIKDRIRMVVYQNDVVTPERAIPRILSETDYTYTDDLYMVLVIHGNTNGLAIGDVRWTPNPFFQPDSLVVPDHTYNELGKATPKGQTTIPVIHKLTFDQFDLANYLGYTELSYTLKGRNIAFVADNEFKSLLKNDAFIIELQSLQLDSYDTLQEQRKNILALVPYEETTDGSVTYEASNLNFLDLNNQEPINITSLNMRLLRSNYATPELNGLTSIVLYFREKGKE